VREGHVRKRLEPSDVMANAPLRRTVARRRGDGASEHRNGALVPRFARPRAAAELRRDVATVR
jgi:hypothetical protein